jgi:serine-type D-Ala-D-Ala carboxypeptidase (penicillin-binding protein 5/6)
MEFKGIHKLYICLIIGFLIVGSIFIYFQFSSSKRIISPLPGFLTAFVNDQVSTLSLWLPILKMLNPDLSETVPFVSAKAALIYDLSEQKALFSKNPKERFPMASLTKIMTAIIALESPKEGDDGYTVMQTDLVGENSMGLSGGEILSLEELIYGLILTSGNDAAETLASNYPAGRDKFIKAMNNKAKSLGLENTHFTNPTGLEGDGRQYATAYDLLVITKYAMRFPLFKKAVGTFDYHIPYSDSHKEFYLENETNLLTSYPGVMGVKDGYTPEAGLCLVTFLNYKNHKIIGIILGSDNRRQEMKDLLDYGLRIQGITPPPHE